MTPTTNSSTSTVTPFSIDIPQAQLDDLRARLRHARFPAPLPGDDWTTGVPVSVLEQQIDGWAAFDWRAYESRLNEVPQFTTEIDGQRIHFVHVRSQEPDAIPLLLTHGWPGSFLEFLDLIGPLVDPVAHGGESRDAFHVIVPSLPGFGFSTPLADSGWTSTRIAGAWVELMDRLEYDRFAVQGGDLGSTISPEVGRVAPDRVIGVHVNGGVGFVGEGDKAGSDDLSDLERDRMARVQQFMRAEFGYIAIQSTRPQLIGEALSDSPAGQFAWIFDKLRAWTVPEDELPGGIIGEDFVFGNASLYWFTASAGSAAYVGYAQSAGWGSEPEDSGVPTAAIVFAHDVGLRFVAERSNTIVRWTDVTDRGGHFAALEEPAMLVDDIRAFLRPLR